MGEVIPFRSSRTLPHSAKPDQSVMRSDELGTPADHVSPGTSRTAPRSSFRSRPDPLWREVAGSVLRDERRRQRRTLAQVAERAGMSVQYLSELERGRKEASSEMLGAACGALGLSLAEFAGRCARTFTSAAARPSGPVLLAA